MGFLLIVLVVRYFVLPFRPGVLPALAGSAALKRRPRKMAPGKEALLSVGAAFLLSRLLILLIAAVITRGSAASDPASWVKWDAHHYLGLAENWYVNEGDARFHLVFFPLYPLLIRGLYLMGMDSMAAGFLISNACLFGAAWALYRLCEMEWGKAAGARAARLLLFAPLSFFFSIPYSESLFVMLTLVSVLMARRRRFGLALALGALASGARLLGLLVAVPIFYEYLLVVRERRGGVRDALLCSLKCAFVAAGFALYLALNWQVTGSPLTFLAHQEEHWSQSMGSLWGTVRYTVVNALKYRNEALQWGTWTAQALAIFCSIALLAASYRKVSPGDGAYALLYIYFAVSPTWLLSGTRYLAAMYALYPMLTVLTEKKRAEYAALAVSIASTCAMVYGYLIANAVL